jgi:hypothetical protein
MVACSYCGREHGYDNPRCDPEDLRAAIERLRSRIDELKPTAPVHRLGNPTQYHDCKADEPASSQVDGGGA